MLVNNEGPEEGYFAKGYGGGGGRSSPGKTGIVIVAFA